MIDEFIDRSIAFIESFYNTPHMNTTRPIFHTYGGQGASFGSLGSRLPLAMLMLPLSTCQVQDDREGHWPINEL